MCREMHCVSNLHVLIFPFNFLHAKIFFKRFFLLFGCLGLYGLYDPSKIAAIFFQSRKGPSSTSFQSILDDETVDYPMGVRQSATILFPDSGVNRSEKSSAASGGEYFSTFK